MLKELISIKDGNEVVGFVVCSPDFHEAYSITKEYFAKECADGNCDDLWYDGKNFVPTLPQSMKDIPLLARRAVKRASNGLTFKDYIANDANLRYADMKKIRDTYGGNVVIALPSIVMAMSQPQSIMLTVAFYTIEGQVGNFARSVSTTCQQQASNFCTCNITMPNMIEYIKQMEQTAMRQGYEGMYWSCNMLSNASSRFEFLMKSVGSVQRLMMQNFHPTDPVIYELSKLMIDINKHLGL